MYFWIFKEYITCCSKGTRAISIRALPRDAVMARKILRPARIALGTAKELHLLQYVWKDFPLILVIAFGNNTGAVSLYKQFLKVKRL